MNKHISIEPKVCNGKPVVKNTRIPLTVILDQLAATGSVQGVLDLYPQLTKQQIVAVLSYCRSMIENE